MDSITVDGTTYKLNDLSAEGQQLARHASATNDQINKLKVKLAIAQTAQISYVDRLKAIASKEA